MVKYIPINNLDEIFMIERGNVLDEKFINIKVDIDKLFFFLQWFYRYANINDMFFFGMRSIIIVI